MTLSRTTLWFATLVAFAGAVYFLTHTAYVPGCLLLLASALCGGVAETRETRRRQERAYEDKFGSSLDQVRSSIDVQAVRRVRDEKGDVPAIRVLRRQAPEVPLKEAVKLVQGL